MEQQVPIVLVVGTNFSFSPLIQGSWEILIEVTAEMEKCTGN